MRILLLAILMPFVAFSAPTDSLGVCGDTTTFKLIRQKNVQQNQNWSQFNTQAVTTTKKWATILFCYADSGQRLGFHGSGTGSGLKYTDVDSMIYSQSYWNGNRQYQGQACFGSVKNYYSDISNGSFQVTGSVVNTKNADSTYNWIQLHNTLSYYNTLSSLAVRDVIFLADSLGLIDNTYTEFIFISSALVPGMTASAFLTSFTYPIGGQAIKYGAFINNVLVSTHIGVISHEMGHAALGWWDEYCAAGCQSTDPGIFDLMSTGVYNGSFSGNSPAYPNPFDLAEAGFITPTIAGSTNSGLTIPYTYPNPTVYQHPASSNSMYHSGNGIGLNDYGRDTNTFFMCRVRQKQGFDTFTPDSLYAGRNGILEIWRSRASDYVELVFAAPTGYPNGVFFPVGSLSSYTPTSSPATGDSRFFLKGIHRSGATTIIDTIITPSYVTTQRATDTTQTTAVLHGIANVGGTATAAYAVYWPVGGPRDSAFFPQSPVTGNVALSARLVALHQDSLYRYMCVICNAGGLVYGDSVTFRTLASPTAPVAVTSTVSGVLQTQAVFNGTVDANGATTSVRFIYGTASNTYNSDSGCTASGNTCTSATYDPAAFSRTITTLVAGTTYYYRIVAQSAFGSVRGNETQFTTPLTTSAPVAVTTAATNVDTTHAVVNGTVNPGNLATTVRFVYGKVSGTYTDSIVAAQSPLGIFNTAQTVNATLNNLSVGTQYFYRVRAYNTSGNTQGSQLSFTTSATKPTVTITATTLIGTDTATVNGTINANGASSAVWFLYRRGVTLTYDSLQAVQSPATGTTTTPVSKKLTGLSPDSTYHVLVASSNSSGYVRSSEISFKQLPPSATAPTVSTGGETHTRTTANLTGVVSGNGASTTVIFDYGTDSTAFSSNATANESPVGANSVTVTASISGLLPSTTYYYRVRASNSVGGTNGTIRSFTTDAEIVTAGTKSIITRKQ